MSLPINQIQASSIPDLDQVLGPIAHAFWISFIILILVYLFKYFSVNDCGKRDFIEISLEVPIDVLTLILTIIITVFCSSGRMHFAHYLFLVTLIVSAICAILRRYGLKYYSLQGKGLPTFCFLLFEWIIGVGWIIYVYNTIA